MASTTALILGGLGAAGAIGGSAINASASQTAASEETQEAQQALEFQEQVFGTNQQNIAPYLASGGTSASALMQAISNGTFGPGSVPAFQAPTAAQAEQTPGYQFNLSQGIAAIDEGAAARGGLNTGGTLKAEQNYGAGLASNTYQQTYNNALSAYQQQLATQQQAYTQLLQPAELGESAAVGAGSLNNQAAANAGSIMTQIGNAQAAGTVGTANAITGGINSGISSASNAYLYNQFLNGGGGQNNNPVGPTTGPANPGGFYAPIDPNVAGGLGLPSGAS